MPETNISHSTTSIPSQSLSPSTSQAPPLPMSTSPAPPPTPTMATRTSPPTSSTSSSSPPIATGTKKHTHIPKHSTPYIIRSLLAGGIAGMVAKTCTAPLDRVKILFQGSNPNFKQFTGSFTGTFRALRFMFEQEGVKGMYKGHSATLLRIFPYAALNFMCFEQYKRLLHVDEKGGQQNMSRLLAGSMAGMTSVFFTYPLDYVHSRLAYQVKLSRYHSISQTIRATIAEDGIRGIYRGFVPTIAGIIPYAGVSFYVFDTLKHALLIRDMGVVYDDVGQRQLHVVWKLLCGAIAGAAAQTAAYPLDVIRRQMQLYGLASQLPQYRHTLHAFQSIIRTSGIRGLYIGLSINYIKVGPAHAISFTVYEWMKEKLHIN